MKIILRTLCFYELDKDEITIKNRIKMHEQQQETALLKYYMNL